MAKVKCKKCGNGSKFLSTTDATVNINHIWNKETQQYENTIVMIGINELHNFMCGKCMEEMPEDVSEAMAEREDISSIVEYWDVSI